MGSEREYQALLGLNQSLVLWAGILYWCLGNIQKWLRQTLFITQSEG